MQPRSFVRSTSELIISGKRPLAGDFVAPPDKSITHRALILAALSNGVCRVSPLSRGSDNLATLRALRALGVEIAVEGEVAVVHGVGGIRGLSQPAGVLDCQNSGTTMRLLAGLLAGAPFEVTLVGDDSLCSRPMSRLLPLTGMGAKISGTTREGRLYPPLIIKGGSLKGTRHDLAIASAQVKSALLLAGLWASGPTVVREPRRSRDHTERLLRALGVQLKEEMDDALLLHPVDSPWSVDAIRVPPDLSSAAFLIAAGIVTDSTDLVVESGVNPTRMGFIEVLEQMGVELAIDPLPDCFDEPVAKMRLSRSSLRGTTVSGELTLRSIDEVPLIAVMAAFAHGKTYIRDAGELRVKESDRLAAICTLLDRFNVTVEPTSDGLVVTGKERIEAASVPDLCDHRMVMAAVVLALGADGESRISGAEHLSVSFPGFAEALSRLGASVATNQVG